ncbi:MAG: hypothetical protein WKG06_00115 [Segetibacter sp.]
MSKQEDIVVAIHTWSERKKRLFQEKYIQKAITHLDYYSNRLHFA